MRDIADSSGAREGDDVTFTVARFAATLYGFVEADAIWDSTQSFNDLAGGAQVARPGTYAGDNARVQFGVRNSRFGIRVKAPATAWFRASGVLEMDFLGATLPIGSGQPYYGSEAAFFNNPTFRLRHAYLKLETPVVDLLMGQYWHLYGWQAGYQPEHRRDPGHARRDLQPHHADPPVAHLQDRHGSRRAGGRGHAASAAQLRRSGGDGRRCGSAFPNSAACRPTAPPARRSRTCSIAVSGDVREVAVAAWSAKPTRLGRGDGGVRGARRFHPHHPGHQDDQGQLALALRRALLRQRDRRPLLGPHRRRPRSPPRCPTRRRPTRRRPTPPTSIRASPPSMATAPSTSCSGRP